MTDRTPAKQLLRDEWARLSAAERELLDRVLARLVSVRTKPARPPLTRGQRLADRVAEFGGSWAFIITFGCILLAWVVLNAVILARPDAFDPYPFVFLNLILSMLAALQAPVIMMSQNRQAELDRQRAEADYEVNLKAELEIRHLHDKLDEIREARWAALVEQQEQQIRLLTELLARRDPET